MDSDINMGPWYKGGIVASRLQCETHTSPLEPVTSAQTSGEQPGATFFSWPIYHGVAYSEPTSEGDHLKLNF